MSYEAVVFQPDPALRAEFSYRVTIEFNREAARSEEELFSALGRVAALAAHGKVIGSGPITTFADRVIGYWEYLPIEAKPLPSKPKRKQGKGKAAIKRSRTT